MYNIRNRFAHLMITLLSVGCGSESVNYPSTTMVIGTTGGEISVADQTVSMRSVCPLKRSAKT